MPQKAWSNKRERQYEHIKESEQKQGANRRQAKSLETLENFDAPDEALQKGG